MQNKKQTTENTKLIMYYINVDGITETMANSMIEEYQIKYKIENENIIQQFIPVRNNHNTHVQILIL